jgi:Tol biopolymer transport system component
MTPHPPTQQASPREPRRQRRAGGSTPIVAPLVALLGLILVGGGSLFAATWLGSIDFGPGAPTATPDPGSSGGVIPTPTPIESVVITPPPERQASVTGTILFARGGAIWAVTGRELRNLSRHRTDSSPVWSPNGDRIYFISTTQQTRDNAAAEGGSKYTFFATDLMSMSADGRGRKTLFESMFRTQRGWWSTTLIQPDVSPDGRTIAVVSDHGKIPTGDTDLNSVVLSTITSTGKNLHPLGVKTARGLGHNDPDWSPDGRTLAFTYDDKSRDVGEPKIGLLNMRNHRLRLLRKGYASPSWSPDGRYIVCERTTGVGRDIVIIDPDAGPLGDELARLTRDGDSFRPTWSPNGDQIAYLHRDGVKIDLWLATLSTDGSGAITLVDQRPVTDDGLVDAESRPSWFISPEEQKPLATIVPPTQGPAASASPEGSTAP